MAQSLSKILLHCIFSTKNRTKLISPEFEDDLHGYIASICREYKSNACKVGGTNGHVHIACTFPRTITAAKLMEEVKGSTSKWMKRKSSRCSNFTWQKGYGVFSLGQSQVETLIKYIDNQKNRHLKISFKEAFLELLKKYEVEYDERYLWD